MKLVASGEKAPEETGRQGVSHYAANIIGIVIIALLLPVMAINMTLIIKSAVHPEKVPTVFGVAPLIVMSGSMQPTIMVDDLIFTKETDVNTLKVGDVIAFQPAGVTTVITHRITKVEDKDGRPLFTTKGDFNNDEDKDPVYPVQVVGRYTRRLPGVGKLAEFLQKPAGMIIFVAVPLVLFILYDMLRRYFYNKKHKHDTDADREELERLRALAAGLEQGGGGDAAPAPAYVPAPSISPAYPPVEGEAEPAQPAEADLEDDEDET